MAVTTKLIIEVIGWIGSAEVILAYFLVSNDKITTEDIRYQLLNFTGAAFLIVNTFYNASYPPMFINIVWVIIAGMALLKIFRSRS